MEDRYSSVLSTCDVAEILENSLNPVVREVCEQGKFDLDKYNISSLRSPSGLAGTCSSHSLEIFTDNL